MNTNQLIQDVTAHLLWSLLSLICLSIVLLFIFRTTKKPVPMVCVVMAFGVCGGFISIQRRLPFLKSEELQLLSQSWPHVFLPPITGGVLALILYTLFLSGLVAGELFPAFEADETATAKDFSRLFNCVAKDYTDYAKLIFWAFVAGFSETFVTDIIGAFAKQATTG